MALSDVSFKPKKGDSLGIIGRNGSGKSTLLQVICSTLVQTAREISNSGKWIGKGIAWPDAASVINFCDSALWIDKGAVQAYDSSKSVTEEYAQFCLQEIYGEEQQLASLQNGLVINETGRAMPVADEPE